MARKKTAPVFSKHKLNELMDRFVEALLRAEQTSANATAKVFTIFIGGKRTTEEVVRSGDCRHANSWIAPSISRGECVAVIGSSCS